MFWIDFSAFSPALLLATAHEKLDVNPSPWESDIWRLLIDYINDDREFIEVSTSGSTGVPKLIQHSKVYMKASAEMTCRFLQLRRGDSVLLCLPVSKIGGMMMVLRAFELGMRLLCVKPSLNPLSELEGEQNFDFAAFAPIQLSTILADNHSQKALNRFRKIIVGGGALHQSAINELSFVQGEVYQTFGMTETISHIAMRLLNRNSKSEHYKLMEGVSIQSDSDHHLIINAPSLGVKDLVTNDIVRIVSETEFTWIGRADNVINSGGLKISPEQLENILIEKIKLPFFIHSVPDEKSMEKVALAIEAKNLSENQKKELKSSFEILEKAMRPKVLLLFKRFCYTENGKVDRKTTMSQPNILIPV